MVPSGSPPLPDGRVSASAWFRRIAFTPMAQRKLSGVSPRDFPLAELAKTLRLQA